MLDITISMTIRQQWIDFRNSHIQNYDLQQSRYSSCALPIEQAFNSGLATIAYQNNSIVSSKAWELNQKFVNHILLERIVPKVTRP